MDGVFVTPIVERAQLTSAKCSCTVHEGYWGRAGGVGTFAVVVVCMRQARGGIKTFETDGFQRATEQWNCMHAVHDKVMADEK